MDGLRTAKPTNRRTSPEGARLWRETHPDAGCRAVERGFVPAAVKNGAKLACYHSSMFYPVIRSTDQ
ncbi:hypothetical protein C0Z17_21445 [Trinickia caryophylli]|nr:hypothetical protein C0Z17_21445 [Trinickia caryophylli]